jgi:16S rRNA (guanine527-N7)-methyltransferase
VTGSTLAPAPPAPAAASTVFGAALPVVQAYAALLAAAGVERGLIGPRETPRLWERHLLNSVGPAELLDDGSEVADVGSGAGLPGLVLAALRPDLRVVLVEPLLRRTAFLSEAVEQLGLSNVEVRRGRAEELTGRLEVDAVVARAVAPLERLAGWALPLLRPGGRLVALKGSTAERELAEAGAALRRLGAVESRVVEVGDGDLLTAGRVALVVAGTRPTPPRRRRSAR